MSRLHRSSKITCEDCNVTYTVIADADVEGVSSCPFCATPITAVVFDEEESDEEYEAEETDEDEDE